MIKAGTAPGLSFDVVRAATIQAIERWKRGEPLGMKRDTLVLLAVACDLETPPGLALSEAS